MKNDFYGWKSKQACDKTNLKASFLQGHRRQPVRKRERFTHVKVTVFCVRMDRYFTNCVITDGRPNNYPFAVVDHHRPAADCSTFGGRAYREARSPPVVEEENHWSFDRLGHQQPRPLEHHLRQIITYNR